jgi:hypothetical protein
VTGGLTDNSQIELVVKELPLMPFNPYVDGHLALQCLARLALRKNEGDDQGWKLRYDDLPDAHRLRSRESQRQARRPGAARHPADGRGSALLRDWKGNIDLTIPVKIDEKGTQIGLGHHRHRRIGQRARGHADVTAQGRRLRAATRGGSGESLAARSDRLPSRSLDERGPRGQEQG